DFCLFFYGVSVLGSSFDAVDGNPVLEVDVFFKFYPLRLHTVASEGGSGEVIKVEYILVKKLK
ncbi:hypothetical protein NP568_23485, partial [Vibrio parahaemolyticus]|nr:hypothetical protein [Vibrio parahaemolyticus]